MAGDRPITTIEQGEQPTVSVTSGQKTFEFVNTSRPFECLEDGNRQLIRRNATLHRTRKRKSPRPCPKATTEKSPTPALSDVMEIERAALPSPDVRMRLLPADTQEYIYHLLQYSKEVMFPDLFPLKSIHEHHPGHRMMMCLVLQDPRVLNSQVALASLRYANTAPNAKPFRITGLKHQQQAMGLVKKWLATDGSTVDVGAAICIAHLASTELILQNLAGWQFHLNALKRMAEDVNVADTLSIAWFTIVEVETCGCYVFDKQPSFVSDHDLERLGNECSKITDPAGFHARKSRMLSLLGTHSVLLVDEGVIDCIAEMQHLTQMINTEEGVAFPELYIRSFTSARIVVEYNLFRLCNVSVSRFSRAMCIAAQIYANRVLRTFERGNLFIHHLAERLKKAIEQTLDEIAESAQMNKEQLISVLWMSVMGAVGSRNGPLRAWFVGMVKSGCYNAGVSTSSALEIVLGSMLWSERSLEKDRIALWKEVEQEEACDPWSLW